MQARSITLQRHVFPVFLLLSTVCLAGASCGKKSSANPEAANDVVSALDKTDPQRVSNATPAATGAGKVAEAQPKSALPGVDLGNLDARKKERFEKLVDSLSSPCGKAHSLRTSVLSDKSCRRGRYAARYVVTMLEDDFDDSEARQFYEKHYGEAKLHRFDLAQAPHKGPADARVVLVEFFDFGCAACQQVAPVLEELVGEYPGDVVLYYKQFPLSSHPDSGPAAAAALAAHAQGKWAEMHALLFANRTNHKPADLKNYAKSIGLDMARFKTDSEVALGTVKSDAKEGNQAGLQGTPTLYVNGREYYGSYHPRYLKLWIEEEIGISR